MPVPYDASLIKEYMVILADRVRFWKEESYSGPIRTVRVRSVSNRGLGNLWLEDPVWMAIEVRRIDDSLEGRIPEKEELVN